MSETNVPAAESGSEVNAYELAFHVLPTVAEGEVASVVATIKSHINTAGGQITAEEEPARFELAYEIVKYLEGRNRKFSSAYFGWVRFSAEPAAMEELAKEVEAMKEILRSLVIRLTKVEEENPFMFHESVVSKRVETIDIDDSDLDSDEEDDDSDEEVTETESPDSVDGEEDEESV